MQLITITCSPRGKPARSCFTEKGIKKLGSRSARRKTGDGEEGLATSASRTVVENADESTIDRSLQLH